MLCSLAHDLNKWISTWICAAGDEHMGKIMLVSSRKRAEREGVMHVAWCAPCAVYHTPYAMCCVSCTICHVSCATCYALHLLEEEWDEACLLSGSTNLSACLLVSLRKRVKREGVKVQDL
jgi:hypothetical protein